MQIKIVAPGVLSTIQDLGRADYLSQAVPVSGAMDKLSARLANICLGNNENDAVIEFTYGNASFTTQTEMLLAYSGDGAFLQIDGGIIPPNKPVFIPTGKTISVKQNANGCRTYLAVAGGWDVPEVLGSKSTFFMAAFGGHEGRALKKGDLLTAGSNLTTITTNLLATLKSDVPNYPNWMITDEFIRRGTKNTARVVTGNEWDWFEQQSREDFLNTDYKVGVDSNRMGYRIEGEPIKRIKESELLSTAVVPGTIQITGDGSPILLMADCQTTGGYPRIGKVATVDLHICAQLKPGDTIRFASVSIKEAEMLYIEQELNLKKLAATIKLKYS